MDIGGATIVILGSDAERFAIEPSEPIAPWRMATWVFRHEDHGERIKR